jgi:farnesyl-diphosphate farnesyltransferase
VKILTQTSILSPVRSKSDRLLGQLGSGQLEKLLKAHARSFALTLSFLPPVIREPLSLGYLLARASDTVADAAGIPRERRLELLEELQGLLESELFCWKPRIGHGELSSSELELVEALPMLMVTLERHRDRGEILLLWKSILKGQSFDLQRFTPRAPALSGEELEEYCFLVAGSVGETWTRLIANYASRTLLRPPAEMEKLGISYGKGLQLLNILRDRSEDLKLGRHYISEVSVPEMMMLAESWLNQGAQYCSNLRPGRLRYASNLPLRLAFATLNRMHRSQESSKVKIPRWEVYGILIKTLPSLVLPSRRNPAS